MRQIRNYSEYREELILELSHSLNCQQTELTLSGLAEKAEPHQATQLKSVSDSLHVVLSRVRQANDENQWFINHILKVITNGLSIFDPLRTSFAVYGSTGSIGGQTNNYGMILSNCV